MAALTEKDKRVHKWLKENQGWQQLREIRDALEPEIKDKNWAYYSCKKLLDEGMVDKDGTYYRNLVK